MIGFNFVDADVTFWFEVNIDDVVVVSAGLEVSLSLTGLLLDTEAAGAAQREEESLLFVSEVSDMTAAGSAQSEEDSLLLTSELVGMASTSSAQSEEETVVSESTVKHGGLSFYPCWESWTHLF